MKYEYFSDGVCFVYLTLKEYYTGTFTIVLNNKEYFLSHTKYLGNYYPIKSQRIDDVIFEVRLLLPTRMGVFDKIPSNNNTLFYEFGQLRTNFIDLNK